VEITEDNGKQITSMMCAYNVGEHPVIDKEEKRTKSVLDFFQSISYIINTNNGDNNESKKR
jgi:hypothetical protein